MEDEALPFDLASAARRRRPRRRASAKKAGVSFSVLNAASSPTQRAGRQGEIQACAYLEKAGLVVLARNLRRHCGEIDLLADDAGVLVFVEVRLRRSTRYGGAAASIARGKQDKIRRTAAALLPGLAQRHFGGRTPPCRFDVVSIDGRALTWIRHAF
ncbi:YraN family protein [Allopusillimonas soli]|uniref:UPF0102 protein H0A68_11845 n=2 Tax=Allopusillimonas soli TaxID=659016 RepID=A0A853FCD3_9BURK|nr:YraN family protein [Allopusillimonas soli]TEA74860.1 YraN family protein [Allopusillimonas soli]